ncbi:hypothetical protein GCM10011390_47920 [Aureimonas endophytica]|uniref:Hemoglobin n=1 Tax=Aureimonas endophytica TaxID=2027858 RepID=A0A917EE24_9HYPH|nr:group III truncated hemoglobin [Aureimonas endophytica]GGE22908.1 hypothetical protein GCM10011390_47920 [Aureimonas endophytica]
MPASPSPPPRPFLPPDAADAPAIAAVEADLRRMVTRFYTAVRDDALLGPLFAEVEDWPAHLDRIAAFWSSIVLGTGRYKSNPFGVHLPLRERLEPRHFERWLALWSATARASLAPPLADHVAAKAARIADSLRAGLLFRPEPA